MCPGESSQTSSRTEEILLFYHYRVYLFIYSIQTFFQWFKLTHIFKYLLEPHRQHEDSSKKYPKHINLISVKTKPQDIFFAQMFYVILFLMRGANGCGRLHRRREGATYECLFA